MRSLLELVKLFLEIGAIGAVQQSSLLPHLIDRLQKNERPYFQAIILYAPSDDVVATYISSSRAELDELTGPVLTVILSEPVINNASNWLSGVFPGTSAHERFSGLKRTDLPCVWLEDGLGGAAAIHLDRSDLKVPKILRGLTEACVDAKSVDEVVQRYNTWADSADLGRAALVAALKEKFMSAGKQKLIAAIFGSAFMVVLLAIAVFIPSPTETQFFIFRVVLAAAAAGFVSMVPGFLNVEVGSVVRAGGALAAFVLIYLVNPAELATSKTATEGVEEEAATGVGG
ncbi:MAG: hypothetical protein V4583_18265 [Pseudomonadota bacterium]